MKNIVVVLLAFAGSFAHAEGAQTFLESSSFDQICSQALYRKNASGDSDSLLGNYYHFRPPVFAESENEIYAGMKVSGNAAGVYAIYEIQKSNPEQMTEISRLQEKAYDISYRDEVLWILQADRLVTLNVVSGERSEILLASSAEAQYDRAYDMIWSSDQLIIAHGIHGLKTIDPISRRIVRENDLGLRQSDGHRSAAVSLTSDGSRLFVGVTHTTRPTNESRGFNGIMELTENGTRTLGKYPYQYGSSGVLSEVSKLTYHEGMLWINNWGIIQYASLNTMRQEKSVRTGWIPTTYFQDDKKWHAEALGEFFLIGKDYYSCAIRSQLLTSRPVHKAGIALRLKDLTPYK